MVFILSSNTAGHTNRVTHKQPASHSLQLVDGDSKSLNKDLSCLARLLYVCVVCCVFFSSPSSVSITVSGPLC